MRIKTSLWSRRAFVQASLAGLCAGCLGGVAGCRPRRAPPEPPGPTGAQKGLFRPVPSPWFRERGDGRLQCELCPHGCALAPGERGKCRVRENRAGVGYTLAYGNPALIQEDPIERKPFFHFMPGSRALSVATAGCNLNCHFCEVWDMALVGPESVHAYDMPPEAVVAHAQASNVRCISYAFGEPVAFFEYMLAVAERAREAGLRNVLQTAGYIQPKPLRRLRGKLDAANVDLKGFDPAFYRQVVGGELEPVLHTLQWLAKEGVHLEITNIVIPTLNDDMGKIRAMCRWILTELGADVPLHFARFYPLYRLADLPRTPVATLDRARDTALDVGLRFVYVGRVTGHESENTFCPACGEPVIKRVGFVVEAIHMQDGKCATCGTTIPGRWG